MEQIREVLPVIFPIGIVFAIGLAYFAHKYDWRIAKWF
jgi:hypothetical protein